ncbi:hypothetical protein [Dasania marina]|uniref:hypothetical protein n=1 Tax=Dasania marina TaxID=471499 RepID=UPI0030D9A045
MSEYELLPGSQPDEANGLVYLSNDKGQILSVEGHYLTIFEPVRDVELRMALEQTLTALQKEIMNDGVSSDPLINAAFMVERSLNAGHIDMIALDVGSVVAAAQEQLGIAGKSEISDDLASLSDRYDSSSKPQVTFGLS